MGRQLADGSEARFAGSSPTYLDVRVALPKIQSSPRDQCPRRSPPRNLLRQHLTSWGRHRQVPPDREPTRAEPLAAARCSEHAEVHDHDF